MLPFLRSDLAQLVAYTPHPGGVGEANQVESAPCQVIDRLDTNENPFDLPDDLKQKLAWVYQQTIESNRYPDGEHWELKQAIADYLMQNVSKDNRKDNSGLSLITPYHLSIGNGSDELIRSLLIATCVGTDGAILVAKPTFSMYGILAQTLGVPVVTIDRSDTTFEMNLSAAQESLVRTPIRVVFVVHPNSPTGNPLTAAELDWLRQLPEQVLVVIDEAYFEFSQTTVLAELQGRSNWMILRTFSKAFRLAAHRVGYAIGHPDLIAALEKVRLPYNLPATTQAAALWAIEQRQTLLDVIPLLQSQRELLFQALTAHSALQVYPSVANFLFVRLMPIVAQSWNCSADAALDRLFWQLKAQGTLVRKISDGLRITVGRPDENQRTIDRLLQLLPPCS